MQRIDLIYEDASILVVRKPAGVESQRGKGLQSDMESLLRGYLSEKTGRSNPYLAVIHRLDRPVAGVMVYAKTKEAAASLSGQLRQKQMNKVYEAVVLGEPEMQEAELTDWLIADKRTGMTAIADEQALQARRAVLRYRTVAQEELTAGSLLASYQAAAQQCHVKTSYLRIWLETGRHHQIRVQLAHLGCPVLGDMRYGQNVCSAAGQAPVRLPGHGIALCAVSLSFRHPLTGKNLTFQWNHDTNIEADKGSAGRGL